MPNIDPALINQELVQALLKEKKRDRLWKNLRFLAWFLLFAYLFLTYFRATQDTTISDANNKQYASLIRISGAIMPDSDFSAESLTPVLQDAFSDKHTAGVVLDIDSPGGTPVQAAI